MTEDRLAVWRRLLAPESAALVRAAASTDAGDVASIARLRRRADPEIVSAALELTVARRKAADKMPARAAALVADPQGVEMASSTAAARWKAERFAVAPRASVLDLCCGIGGDAMELAEIGLDVTGVDHDPLRAWACGVNAGCRAVARDIEDAESGLGSMVHIDPSRRDIGGRRRRRTIEDMQPGPDRVRAVLRRSAGACVKLAPGWDPSTLAEGESEWVSERGGLTQSLLWTGALAPDPTAVRATMLPGRHSLSGRMGAPTSTDRVDSFVFVADPALERARLTHLVATRHGLTGLGPPGAGMLTGPEPTADPWLRIFRARARMPWNARAVRRWLGSHDAGIVTIKTRGGVVEPDALQRRLRGDGATPFVVFVQRFGGGIEALITERVGGVSSIYPDERNKNA